MIKMFNIFIRKKDNQIEFYKYWFYIISKIKKKFNLNWVTFLL